MKCLICNSTDFEIKNKKFPSEIKGDMVDVIVPSYSCKNCDDSIMDADQMNTFLRAVTDAYKRKIENEIQVTHSESPNDLIGE